MQPFIPNSHDFFVLIRADDFLKMVKPTEMLIFCPSCKSNRVIKNGKSEKGYQSYLCRNPECARQKFHLGGRGRQQVLANQSHIRTL